MATRKIIRDGQEVVVNDYGQTMAEANDPSSWKDGKYVGPAVTKTEQINGGQQITYANGWQKFTPAQVNPQGLTVQQMSQQASQGATNPSVVYNPDGTRSAADKALADYYASKTPKTAAEIANEEEQIRQRRLQQQQAEIDSINAMYTNILNQVAVDNKDRLGSTYTMQALSGERGSKSGAADVKKTTDYNQSIIDAKNAEKQAKIAQIMSGYQTKIDDDIMKAAELREKDANAWIDYQKGEIERNRTNAADLRKNFLAAGLKAEDIDESTWQKIAEAGGYTVEQAKALYKSEEEQAAADFVAKEQKALAEADKAAAEAEKIKAETGKLLADTTKTNEEKERLLISKGYIYMATPAIRDSYAAKGRVMVTVNGRTYMAPIEKDTNKTTGGTTTQKNYTATTIPADVKADLLADKAAGFTLDEVMAAYPEVSTSYLQSMYGQAPSVNWIEE